MGDRGFKNTFIAPKGATHEAEPLVQQALAIRERVLGPNHLLALW
jgi:hypothetical protein